MSLLTDIEKIERYNALENLRKRIGSCFGSVDGLFANHFSDEENAKELLEFALISNITLQEIIELIFGYLYRLNYPFEHISKQIIKAKEMFKMLNNEN